MKALCVALIALACSAKAVEFSTAEIAGKHFTVCRVNVKKEKISLYLRDQSGQPFKRFSTLDTFVQTHSHKLVFAMNGGMYHGDFSPVGLFVSEGSQSTPLNTAEGQGNFFLKPNGVFAITDAGARVVDTSQYSKLKEQVILATQSGPMLVVGGKIHQAFNATSTNRLRRNGVGIPSLDTAIFVISEEPVTFHELATLFRDTLHCANALFLDGTVSSLFAPKLDRSDFRMDLGPIIGVTE
ncbi:MAG: periplasmic protein-like protein [Verrucomicrobiaceae bacterium]|nr:periplasmic protein-like protein [Verrucomicrobiaceae bacterium]